MKPFDLERAKAGDPVYMNARYTGWNHVGPVFFVGVSENDLPVVEVQGKPWRVSPEYLFMAPVKRTFYVNLHRQDGGLIHAFVYGDALEAGTRAANSNNWAGTFPCEIEV